MGRLLDSLEDSCSAEAKGFVRSGIFLLMRIPLKIRLKSLGKGGWGAAGMWEVVRIGVGCVEVNVTARSHLRDNCRYTPGSDGPCDPTYTPTTMTLEVGRRSSPE